MYFNDYLKRNQQIWMGENILLINKYYLLSKMRQNKYAYKMIVIHSIYNL